MNILITGGAGFIGSSLADRLIIDNKIIIVDNFNDYYSPSIKENNIQHNLSNPNYKLYKKDICDTKALTKIFKENDIDAVIHIAASAGVRESIENPELFIKSNISGTLNILELMREYQVNKLVFASSSSVYGNCKEEKFSEELKTTKPISPYAATKSACEQLIYTYSQLYNIKSICLRFFTVYGPRQRPDLAISKFTSCIKANQPISLYGDGTTYRDYTYIDDILDGIILAIKYNKTQYEIINLGSGTPISLIEMVKVLENTLDKKANIQWLPMQKGDVDKTFADITKAQNLLGYSPKVLFKDGIKKYINKTVF